MTDWFGSIKSKVNDINQKLTSPVEFRHLLNFRVVLFLIIIIGIAVVVVFTQYPQVLRSFAKPPQSICGYNDTRCCRGNVCNSGLACYSPDNTTPKTCKANSAVCGNSVDRPCCLITDEVIWESYCNASLRCDKSKSPPYPYQNPWNNGLCAVSYDVCGGQNEACCGTIQDNLIDRCDASYHCVQGRSGQDPEPICGYVTIDTNLQDYSRVNVGSDVTFSVWSNIVDGLITYIVECGNGQSADPGPTLRCVYNNAGTYIMRANVQGGHDPQPVAYLSRHVVVVDPNTTPTPRPTRRPTPPATPTPGSRSTPTSVPPTSSYTCSYTCLPNGEDCYQEAGWGSCPSGKFCCQTIDGPPVATPTTKPPNTPVPPTKVPNGGYCNSNSQCGSNFCCNNYCQPSNYQCPS